MKRHIINFKEYLVLLACILVSLILLFSNRKSQIEALKSLTLDVIGSVQAEISSFSRSDKIEEENRFLRNQNTRLALENSRMREAITENEKLKKLIGFKESYPFTLIAAKVISGTLSGVTNYILLEVGEKDGVKKNMPLVIPDGLIGKIHQIGESHSVGHLLLDQNFRVSAKVQRVGIKGIVSWKEGNICQLNEIPNRSDVKIGDAVVTSGYGQIFPEGIYIGKVVLAEDTKRSLSMRIEIKPDVDFQKIDEVLVVVSNNAEESSK